MAVSSQAVVQNSAVMRILLVDGESDVRARHGTMLAEIFAKNGIHALSRFCGYLFMKIGKN